MVVIAGSFETQAENFIYIHQSIFLIIAKFMLNTMVCQFALKMSCHCICTKCITSRLEKSQLVIGLVAWFATDNEEVFSSARRKRSEKQRKKELFTLWKLVIAEIKTQVASEEFCIKYVNAERIEDVSNLCNENVNTKCINIISVKYLNTS